MAFIYGLYSSSSPDIIRYVGKTQNLKNRLKRHLSDYYLKDDTYKNRWIKSELKSNNEIKIVLLEEVSNDTWENAEIKWIKHYKNFGYKLTNGTCGGEGLYLDNNEVIEKRNYTRKINNFKSKKNEIKKYKIRAENDCWIAERKCPGCKNVLIHKAISFPNICALLKKSVDRKCLSCRSTGRKLSDKSKQKIRESKKNLSSETRAKLSKVHKGKKLSKQIKNKISNSLKGKKQSIETINKRIEHHKKKIICTNTGREYESIKAACKDLNCSSASVIDVLNKQREFTKGLNFIYKNSKNE